MISDKDRSGWFGASDVDFIVGNWHTKTFEKWWMQKLGINTDHFDNEYTLAGTHKEHQILSSLGKNLVYDKQIIIPELRLRVNLDGNTSRCIYECKTYKADKPFKMPKRYERQVRVQMFASGIKMAKIVVYGLENDDYSNFFLPIDKKRLNIYPVVYDEKWINDEFLPKLKYLSECLMRGVYPIES